MSSSASVCAVIVTSARRLPGALRTATTFAQHHGQVPVLIAVVDDRYRRYACFTASSDSEWHAVDVRATVDKQLGIGEYERLVALYSADDLVELLRPVIVKDRLSEHVGSDPAGPTVVLSIPDDAEIVAPLTDVINRFGVGIGLGRGLGMALAVVRTTPVPRDGRIPDEVDLAESGLVDHQLFAAVANGVGVLDWWIERSRRHRFVEPDRLALHCVRWLDQAKRMFPDVVVEVPGLTRSYLNADESSPGSAAVLRFPDFDPERPWIVSPRGGEWPRIVLSAHMDLRIAAKARSASLRAQRLSNLPFEDDGSPFDHISLGYTYDNTMRALYSEALHAAERNGTPPPVNPFGAPDAFVDWLREDMGDGLNRYLHRARDMTPDLAGPFRHDSGALLEWARISGPDRGFSPSLTGVLPGSGDIGRATTAPSVHTPGSTFTPGINLVGLFKAEMGIGEAARLTYRAIQRSTVPCSPVLDSGTAHRQNDPFDIGASSGFQHDVNVVVANADALKSVIRRLDESVGASGSVFADLPTIGLWFWELETFPETNHDAFRYVDEVWVASQHVRRAIAPAAAEHGVPVHVIPLGASLAPTPLAADEVAARGMAVGIPVDRFCFLFSFDHRSIAERKNPWGLIDAFTRAFPTPGSSGPVLVIKTISGDVDLLGRERLRWLAATRADVILIEGFLDVADRQALLQRCNAYISLHRAEGWGLTMAEAMTNGIPTIATGYSGNLEFMNDRNSWLVDYRMTPIPHVVPHYGGMGTWAEPDLDQAAQIMRQIVDDPTERNRRAQQGLVDLRAMGDSGAGGRFVLDRLREIRRVDLQPRRENMRAKLRFNPDREQENV